MSANYRKLGEKHHTDWILLTQNLKMFMVGIALAIPNQCDNKKVN